ncbi:putative leucine-rich repeat domain superfamily [Helianthus annuus]|uniref:Leucine-rich repeat domain superfamily n=1 Tax=Helianthus annuus TaxID=4232 RepID=A0A9K3E972_HELAN|nr:probable disease resistance protein At5g66900 [Helianthus annuus]KAF5769336.1 putative leucine-rich repeat domain superfamily [Helianthus annuus]KAJ0464389.1 putative leucine-rich repeat domain superfamily [Helianthus annuus]KAJ0840613.1 putative leucine-rich repeat domain superfamily [Helianthus annuus]
MGVTTETALQFAPMVVVSETARFKTPLKRLQNTLQICLHSNKLIRLNNGHVKFFHTQLHLKADDLEDKLLPASTTVGFNRNLEELTLEASSQNYSLPESINRMDQLKVLTIKGNCDHPSKLHNLSFIASLPNLTTIKFEHVSVPSLQPIFALRNLKQLSFVMCEIGNALKSFTRISSCNMLPNLTHLEFDMCYDLKQLPSWICNLAHLQKLSITNCHELDALPKELGCLSSLESLNLHSCTKLQGLPASIGSLRSLNYIDISDCLSISVLPEEIGELCGLQVLKMNGCTGLQELPLSTSELSQLDEVICDEETSYMWMDFESEIANLKINVVEDDRLETYMKIVQ